MCDHNYFQGKTTMVYRFLEKEETPKPTLAMDYSFGRKAGKSLVSLNYKIKTKNFI